MKDEITISREELKRIIEQEVSIKLKEVLTQTELFPGIIKTRHLDANDIGLTITEPSFDSSRDFTFDGNIILTTDNDINISGQITSSAYNLLDGTDEGSIYLLSNSVLGTSDDLKFPNSGTGIILTDRTTATAYRLYVNSGVLAIEAA